MSLEWAERLLSKKDEGSEYLNAGSDWLGIAMLYAHIDRKPEVLFNDAIKLTKKHLNQEGVVKLLQKVSKQSPKYQIINQRLKEESLKLAEKQLEDNKPDAAKQTIEILSDLSPQSGKSYKVRKILSKIKDSINNAPTEEKTKYSSTYNQNAHNQNKSASIKECEIYSKSSIIPLETAIKENPHNMSEHVALANLYILQEKYTNAIKLIEDFQSSQDISSEDEIILEEILDEAYGSIEPETINHAEEQRGYQAYEIEP